MKGIKTNNPNQVLQKGFGLAGTALEGIGPGRYVVHDGRFAWGVVHVNDGKVDDFLRYKSLQVVVRADELPELTYKIQGLLIWLNDWSEGDKAAGKFLKQKAHDLLDRFVDIFSDLSNPVQVKDTKQAIAVIGEVLESLGALQRQITIDLKTGKITLPGVEDMDLEKANLIDELIVHLEALQSWLQAAGQGEGKAQPPPQGEQKCQIVNKDTKRQIITGIVLEPNTEDLQGEKEAPEVIEDAFLRWSEYFDAISIGHTDPAGETVRIVEKWIARSDFAIGKQSVKKGSWLLSLRIKDPVLWAQIEAGEITGFSIGGTAKTG